MNLGNTVFASLFSLSLCAAQTLVGLTGADTGTTLNQQFLAQRQGSRSSTSVQPHVVVFTGDRVIPQFVDGGSWKTSIFLVNLENHATSFQVLFFNDDGTDLIVPVIGQGPVRGMNITLNSAASVEFETTGVSANLANRDPAIGGARIAHENR